MQISKCHGSVWLDQLFRGELDCHRVDIVNDDAEYVSVLALDGCRSSMYLESVLLALSKYADLILSSQAGAEPNAWS